MMMMMMILKAFGVFSYIRERLFFRASDEISSEKSLEKSVFFFVFVSRESFFVRLSFQKKQSQNCRKFSETPQSNQSFYPRISCAASSRCYSTDASKNHKKQFFFFCSLRRLL